MPPPARHRPVLSRRSTQLLLALAAVIVAVTFAIMSAPWALERYANAKLADMRIYQGELADVDLDFANGIGAANGFLLEKRDGGRQVFITAERIEVNLRYGELLKGRPVVDLRVVGCEVNLVLDPDESKRQLGERLRWSEFLWNLPFAIGNFTATSSVVLVHGVGGASKTIEFRDIALQVAGLDTGESVDNTASGPDSGQLELAALAMDAPLNASGTFNPSLSEPTFDLEVHLGAVPLEAVNPWLTNVAALDVEQGTFEADLMARLRGARLRGTLDAQIVAAEFAGAGDEDGGPFKKIAEAIADFGIKLFENDDGNLAQRMTIEAEVMIPEHPDLKATLGAIKDAFQSALKNRKFQEVEAVTEAE